MKTIINKLLFILLFLFSFNNFVLADNTLEDNELHAVLSIITNFILDSSYTLSPPTLTSDTPTQTIEDNTTIEVNGAVGSTVYLNGEYVGIIGENGTFSIVLPLIMGENNFEFTLKDATDRESEALHISIIKLDAIKPLIVLKGLNPQIIEFTTPYVELGANAYDYTTSNLDSSIKIDSTSVTTNIIGDYNVTYDVEDEGGNQADRVTRLVQVRDRIAPVFTNEDNVSVAENQTTAIRLAATDKANDLIYSIDDNDSFDVDETTGVVTFKNPPDYEQNTNYHFTATVTDGSNNKTEQNVTINVTNLDDTAPIFHNDDNVSVEENQQFAIELNVTDANYITYSISGVDSGSFDITTTGVITFVSFPDYEDKISYTFTATADDGINTTDQNITINIINIDDSDPIFHNSDTATVDENQRDAINLNATDDFGTVIYSIATGYDSAYFTVNTSTGVVTFKQDADYEHKVTYTFVAIASDGTNSANQKVTITVTNLDDTAPVFTNGDTVSVAENQTDAIDLDATDDFNSPLTYSISGGDYESFEINSSTGVVTFLTAPDFESGITQYTFTATVSDGFNEAHQNVTINVTNLDDTAPIFHNDDNVSVEENQQFAIELNVTDANYITYSISGVDSGSFDITTTGVITFVSFPDYEDKISYTFTATADDGINTTDQNITINIINIDDSDPIFHNSDTATVDENQRDAINLNATDDFGTVIYSIATGYDSAYFTVNTSTGVVTFKQDADYEHKVTYTFVAIASDGTNSANQKVTITVTNLDDTAPVFTNGDTVSVAENQTDAIDLDATDDFNSPLTYSISGGDYESFEINSSTGVVTFLTAPDFESGITQYTFTATVSDGFNEAYQNVTINVYDVPEAQAPKKTGQTVSYDENGQVIGDNSLKDDGYYKAGFEYSYTRYDDGTVLDTVTSLMWADDDAVKTVTKPWITSESYTDGNYHNTAGDTATNYCEDLELSTYVDWRLPTRKELQEINLASTHAPSIDGEFQNTADAYYWSSTSRASSENNAWYVDFNEGSSNSVSKDAEHYIRCVRVSE